jgi:hypothetical protein
MSRFQPIENLQLAIGLAIYEYQFVEEATLRVLYALYEDSKALEIAFFHLQGESRLRFMDRITKQSLSPPDRKRWVKLRGAIGTCAKDRNAFVHHVVTYDGPRPVLRPSIFDRSRYGDDDEKDATEEPYYVADIYQSVRSFRALTAELRHFAQSIHWNEEVRQGYGLFHKQLPEPPTWSLPVTRRSKAHRKRI